MTGNRYGMAAASDKARGDGMSQGSEGTHARAHDINDRYR